MKGIIIYKGKYGATRQYAAWIGESLQLPVLPIDSIQPEKLATYDFVVIGSSVYIGRLLIRDWLKQNINILQNKHLFLFVVCGTPSSEQQKQEGIITDNVPAALRDRFKIFFMPGRLEIKKLSWRDNLMLKIGAWLEKDPVKKKAMSQDMDGVKKENIVQLLKSIATYKLDRTETNSETISLPH